MIKRAVIGRALTGLAGAVIGGATAKKNSVSTQENDLVYHDCNIIINMDSLSVPIIRVHIGSGGKTVNEIVTMMKLIIYRRLSYQNK